MMRNVSWVAWVVVGVCIGLAIGWVSSHSSMQAVDDADDKVVILDLEHQLEGFSDPVTLPTPVLQPAEGGYSRIGTDAMQGLLLTSSQFVSDDTYVLLEYSTEIIGDPGVQLFLYEIATNGLRPVRLGSEEEGSVTYFGLGREEGSVAYDVVVTWDDDLGVQAAMLYDNKPARLYQSVDVTEPWIIEEVSR